MLPCCCGTLPIHQPYLLSYGCIDALTSFAHTTFQIGKDCNDTAAFVTAAHLHGFQTLLRGCKAQLKDTNLDFATIDYGFGWEKSFRLWYAAMSRGQKAGIVIGIIIGGIVVMIMLASIIACC